MPDVTGSRAQILSGERGDARDADDRALSKGKRRPSQASRSGPMTTVKLPDRIELVARIRHHSRGYIAQLERNEPTASCRARAATGR